MYGIGNTSGLLGEGAGANAESVVGTGSGNGNGVIGTGGGTGAGVYGPSGASVGPGVYGISTQTSGTGVLAENTAGGIALHVSGPAAFSSSGLLTVAAGKSSTTRTGVALTSASLVLATVQQHATGVYVQAAVPNITARSFTVYLGKTPSASTKAARFVVN